MATTTNFGWETPDDTDLVKDGALAMRTLGNSIDSSFVDLKGGTTGQVLAKASNTDLDYTWVTQDDANAIQNAIVDAKGDLIAASAADTPARLAVGNNGETLVADSSTSTGLRWQGSTAAGRNFVLNGAFDIWQRNTSVAGTTTAFTADRWQAYRNVSGSTFTRQNTSDTTNLPFIQFCLRVARDSGNTSTNTIYTFQNFETVNSIPLAGRTVTLSFYARRGANYSAPSNVLNVNLETGTGTDQNYGTGFTGGSAAINQTATLTTTWQRFSFSATLASTVTQLAPVFYYSPSGTAGAADFFEITGVQLEVGSVATNFSRAQGTLAGELAACQRYYWRIQPSATATFQVFSNSGWYQSSTNFEAVHRMPVSMRTAPTSIDAAGTLQILDTAGTGLTTSVGVLSAAESNPDTVRVNWQVTGATAGRFGNVRAAGSSTAYIGFSAEL